MVNEGICSGKWVDEEDAKISVFDHGLLYGDGVFEGIRVYNNRVFLLNEHIDRLYDSAKAIALNIPMNKEDRSEVVAQTCRQMSSKMVIFVLCDSW